MKISIITVAFNEEKNIRRTIESVLNQTSCDFEYIICDGKSADKTVEIAKEYKNAFFEKGISYVVNSEKDKGIYDGMNKGIDLATGDYIFFLNAGDWFYDNEVISTVVEYATKNQPVDAIYGNLAPVLRNIVGVNYASDNLYTDMTIFHQAVFVSTILMKKYKFNTEYRISADYDVLLTLKDNGHTFKYVDKIISYFSPGGISTLKVRACLKEHFKVCASHGVKVNKFKVTIKKHLNKLSYFIKMKMPRKLWYWWSIKIKKKTVLPDEMKDKQKS